MPALFPAWDSDVGTGTIWAIFDNPRNGYQLVWLSADDGEAVEFGNRDEASEFLRAAGLEGRWNWPR